MLKFETFECFVRKSDGIYDSLFLLSCFWENALSIDEYIFGNVFQRNVSTNTQRRYTKVNIPVSYHTDFGESL